jgi:hypothetical protein
VLKMKYRVWILALIYLLGSLALATSLKDLPDETSRQSSEFQRLENWSKLTIKNRPGKWRDADLKELTLGPIDLETKSLVTNSDGSEISFYVDATYVTSKLKDTLTIQGKIKVKKTVSGNFSITVSAYDDTYDGLGTRSTWIADKVNFEALMDEDVLDQETLNLVQEVVLPEMTQALSQKPQVLLNLK